MATEVRKLSSGRQVYGDSKGEYVVVKKSDTLSKIAREASGSPYNIKNYQQLATINKLSNPNLIMTGSNIYLKMGSTSSTSTSKTNTNKPTNVKLGEISTIENTLLATWDWSKESTTEKYKVVWTYNTGDGVWLQGNVSDTTIDADVKSLYRQSTYSIPSGAKQVRFKVKPIAKKKKKGDKEVAEWTAEWSDTKTWNNDTPLTTPSVPETELNKLKLTMRLKEINIPGAEGIQFAIQQIDDKPHGIATKKVAIVDKEASYTANVVAGAQFKVRCRAYKGSMYSDWTAWSDPEETMPTTPAEITVIKAQTETSVYLEWSKSTTADSYEIEYTTEQKNFDISDEVQKTTVNGDAGDKPLPKREITGLTSGQEYFFRVRAVKGEEKSGWCPIKSVVVGEIPAAPTTWSSTTTAIVGEPVNLYWIHNSVDGSVQKKAKLELTIGDTVKEYEFTNEKVSDDFVEYIPLSKDDLEDGKTQSCVLKTDSYEEGAFVKWRVCTAGITNELGDWSIKRNIDIYQRPTLTLSVTNPAAEPIDTLAMFPFYIRGIAGPTTQTPLSYHIAITANETYETVDNLGNDIVVSAGAEVYSKHFDTSDELLIEMSANNIDLENGISYTVTGTVSMNSGLMATTTPPLEFIVSWTDAEYTPTAAIGIDRDSYTASIRPYCEDRYVVYRKVIKESSRVYTLTDEELDSLYGEPVNGATVSVDNEYYPVYFGTTADGEDVYYCMVEMATPVTDVYLSVYRREFDGSFTELATGLDGERTTTITDPHPALDFARYRIVAISKSTGAVSFFDPPGEYVGCPEIIIQWAEDWTPFDTTEDAELEQPPWTGSLLRLPYNIDVSNSAKREVELVKYAGRENPVAYYGTHLGETATWSTVIEANDEETIYALRRLSRWAGDVYVREPSGTGYWANITVSFSQKHSEQTIPVSFAITRVEGGA